MSERFDASGPNFLTTPRSGIAPLSVVFTDTSTAPQPIKARLWTFGDGARLRQIIAGVPTTYTQDLAAPLPVVLQSKTGANVTRYVYALGTRPLAHAEAAWQCVGISAGGCVAMSNAPRERWWPARLARRRCSAPGTTRRRFAAAGPFEQQGRLADATASGNHHERRSRSVQNIIQVKEVPFVVVEHMFISVSCVTDKAYT